MAVLSRVLYAFLLASSLTSAAAIAEPDSTLLNENLRRDDFITSCPTEVTYYNSPHGNSYRRCMNTNYVGPDREQIAGITSLVACLNECSIRTGCPKAAWDHTTNVCHIKAREPVNSWVESTRFHSAINPWVRQEE